jgi:hypothetical protein
VRHRPIALDRAHGPYPRGAVWADPDLDHAAEQMIRVASGDPLVERRTRVARARVEGLYGLEAASRGYHQAFVEIFDRFGIGTPEPAAINHPLETRAGSDG